MNRSARIYLLLFAIGVTVIAIPDNNVRIVRLNQHHGLSAQDMAGAVLILVSWLAGLTLIFRRRENMINKLGKTPSFLFLLFYIISLFGIITGLLITAESLLWIAVCLATIINLVALLYALLPRIRN